MTAKRISITRQTVIGDVANSARELFRRAMPLIVGVLGLEFAVLALQGDPGAQAFALIAAGNIIALYVWSKAGVGLPLLPLMAVQNILAYGLPLAMHNETVTGYPTAAITAAGWDVFAFSLAMVAAWRVGMEAIPTCSSVCYGLQGLDDKSPKLARMGMAMVLASSAYEFLSSITLLDPILQILPSGAESILHVFISAVSACGFFLAAMMIGKGAITGLPRAVFWMMLVLQCYIAASSFLLSTTITVLFSVIIGSFWGSGKVPWRLLAVTVVVLSFLNLGKFTMRERYWQKGEGNPTPQVTFAQMPAYYNEWVGTSWATLLGQSAATDNKDAYGSFGHSTGDEKLIGQSIFDRINNLQNLLFVIDATESRHLQPVGGATYLLIPPLLVPRILWPDKPRTHEGQVLLNVRFGRQDLNSTLHTYIAWGLLAEAYGNFGPLTGAILLGLFLGFGFAWVEKYVARKLVLSTEGFLAFTLFLAMANSFEMVASVLVTSLFQACVPIILASAPFVHRVIAQPRAAVAVPPSQ